MRRSRSGGRFDKLGSTLEKDDPDARGRKRYSAEFKSKVALDAIRGEGTVAQPTVKQGVHQTMINAWKKQAVEGGPMSFRASRRHSRRPATVRPKSCTR